MKTFEDIEMKLTDMSPNEDMEYPIAFSLKVVAEKKKGGSENEGDSLGLVIDIDLNDSSRFFNGNQKIVEADQLIAVLKFITEKLIPNIKGRIDYYNNTIKVQVGGKSISLDDFARLAATTAKQGINEDYIHNIAPEFDKIDRIKYVQNSAGKSNVSTSKRYNGDIRP